MNLSAKMPAQMDSTLAAKMPAQMASDATAIGGGSEKPPVVQIIRDSTQNDPEWLNKDDKGADWQTEDKKLGSEWEVTDRKE